MRVRSRSERVLPISPPHKVLYVFDGEQQPLPTSEELEHARRAWNEFQAEDSAGS